MKRTLTTLAAVGALALVTISSASASDRRNSASQRQPGHRQTDRQRTHDIAHSIGLTRKQDNRLHKNLRRQEKNDRRERRLSRRRGPINRNWAPNRRFAPRPYDYWTPSYGNSRRDFGYPGFRYGRSRPRFNDHGLSFSTRGFSFQLGH